MTLPVKLVVHHHFKKFLSVIYRHVLITYKIIIMFNLYKELYFYLTFEVGSASSLTLGTHVRSEGYCSCPVCVCMYVYMCVSALICRHTHWNHKRKIPTDSSQYRNHFKCCRFSLKCLVQKLWRSLLTSSSSGILALFFSTK